MFTVFNIDEDHEFLAIRHAASPVTVVVRNWGEGGFEPLYGMRKDRVSGEWEREELPGCFALADDAKAALRAYEDGDEPSGQPFDWQQARDYREGDLF